MTPAAHDVLNRISALSPEDRVELVIELRAQLTIEIAPGWEEEIDRRLDKIDSGSAELIPAEQVLAELRRTSEELERKQAGRRVAELPPGVKVPDHREMSRAAVGVMASIWELAEKDQQGLFAGLHVLADVDAMEFVAIWGAEAQRRIRELDAWLDYLDSLGHPPGAP